DIRPRSPQTAAFDLLRDDAVPRLAGVHVVVHLASRVDPPHPLRRHQMRRLHEEGTLRLIEASKRAGVRRFVLVSSAVVYGARPDNPVPLRESDAVRPLAHFPYAVDKAKQEEIVREHEASLEIVIARPAIVYGPGARNHLTEFLRRAPGILPALEGKRPPLQFVHVEDVAMALRALALSSCTGAYNVAGKGVIGLDDVARLAGLRIVDVPRKAISPLLTLGQWWLPGHLRAPPYLLDHLMYPFVMSSERLETDLGVVSQRDPEETVQEMLRGRRTGGT
ncbi:MAG: NAD-dependent epimerase/dehydratase family protein, partial [Myxococcota bacterium]